MSLSKGNIETLIDLVEIKLGCFEAYDREDQRTIKELEGCLRQLEAMNTAETAVAGDRSKSNVSKSNGAAVPAV